MFIILNIVAWEVAYMTLLHICVWYVILKYIYYIIYLC